MSAPDPSSLIGRRLGRFKVRARLGQGGLATVWRAHDEMLGRDVALKVLDPGLAHSPKVRRRFIHEAQTASMLDHPGVVTVFDAAECDGLAYIALSFVDGETVSDLARRQLMPVAEAVRIAIAAGEALAHAHARGVIHRDVTGRNVMVGRDGRVFVLDFGLALAAGMSRLTTSETSLGTVAYMAPEAFRGEQLDARADVYGLGVVLFEALTGGFPFPGERNEVVSWAKLSQEPRRPQALRPEIGDPLDALVLRAIARDRDSRIPSMEVLVGELSALGLGRYDAGGSPQDADAAARRAVARAARALGEETGVTRPDPGYLAILPFVVHGDAGAAPAPEWALAQRIPESLGAGLGAAPRLYVVPVPAAEVEAFARDGVAATAERLGVNLVMTGEIVHEGSRLRAIYSILDAARGVQIAADIVDGSAAHPLELEDAVVGSVWRGLELGSPPAAGAGRRAPDAADSARYLIGCRYLERYDLEASVDGAIRTFEDLAAGAADDPRVHAALARAYLAKHRLTKERSWETKAAAACQRAGDHAPDLAETRIALADLEIATGRAEAACELLARVVGERPDDGEAWITLARAAVGCGDHARAREAARRAIALRPVDWRGHSWLGVADFECSDFAGAYAAWQRVVELVPDSARGQMNLGSALFALDRLDEAATAYRRSLDLHPTATGFTNLGTTLYYLHDAGALEAFEQAVALAPSNSAIWGNLGNAACYTPGHETRGREALGRAVLLARERLDSDPNDAHLWARLAGWLAHLGANADALAAIDRALTLLRDDAEVLGWVAKAHHVLGDDHRAIACLEAAVEHGYGIENTLRWPGFEALRGTPEFDRLVARAQRRSRDRGATPNPGGRP